MTLKQTLCLVAEDTRERARIEGKRYGLVSYLKLLLNPPALAVVIYRFQHWLHTSNWPVAAEILRRLNVMLFKTDIHSGAEIGEHFMLFHSNCIFVGERVTIGRDVYLVHHNTIDAGPLPNGTGDERVYIDDKVIVSAGARILGNVTVGHDSFVGAGAVVTTDLPECSFYFEGPQD